MNPDSENFEALRKLMALKRYEQPPPGYFDQLHTRIILRLEDVEPTFWERMAGVFVLRPAMAYALGLAFCGSVATGFIYALQIRPVPSVAQHNPSESWEVAASSASVDQNSSAFTLHVPGYDRLIETNDTMRTSLFHPFNPQALPVSYGFGR